MTPNKPIKLYGCQGCGSAIAEAFFLLADVPYDRIEVDYNQQGALRDELLDYNPLGQVPTLVLPSGKVLTETLAIMNYANDLNPSVHLIPTNPELRPAFFRWSTFLVTAIYPTWTYGDSPEKWIEDESAAPLLRAATDEHRKKLWSMVETNTSAPYFLGETFSALDVYLCTMTHWRPRQEWFKKNTPKIYDISQKILKHPKLTKLWKSEGFTE